MTPAAIQLTPYTTYLYVIASKDLSKALAGFNFRYKSAELNYDKDDEAATYETSTDKPHALVVSVDLRIPKERLVSLAVHEAVHVVNAVFGKAGVKFDKDNDETQAYFTAWVVELILKQIKQNGVK